MYDGYPYSVSEKLTPKIFEERKQKCQSQFIISIISKFIHEIINDL